MEWNESKLLCLFIGTTASSDKNSFAQQADEWTKDLKKRLTAKSSLLSLPLRLYETLFHSQIFTHKIDYRYNIFVTLFEKLELLFMNKQNKTNSSEHLLIADSVGGVFLFLPNVFRWFTCKANKKLKNVQRQLAQALHDINNDKFIEFKLEHRSRPAKK